MKGNGKPLRVLLTGGGTGGHVYPTLAVYEILKQEFPVSQVLYVGSKGRAEEKIVPRFGIPLSFTPCAPLFGLRPWSLAASVFVNFVGTLKVLLTLLRFRPHVILAAGGYVSAPAVFASFLLRPFLRPLLVIDEQNVVPGLMNKLASLFAQAVLVSFRETAFFVWNNNCVFTGYPVRSEFLTGASREEARQALGIAGDRNVVTVFGGSMGARSINRLMAETLAGLGTAEAPLTVFHSTGMSKGAYEAWDDTLLRFTKAAGSGAVVESSGEGKTFRLGGGRLVYHLLPYIHDMALHLQASDLVICRGGAGALSEVMALGRPAVVIPKRDLPGDHQELNAINLASAGGCEVVFERKTADGVDYIDAPEFREVFTRLLGDPARLQAMANRAREKFPAGCRGKIVDTLRSLLAGREVDAIQELVEPEYVRLQKQVDHLVAFLRNQPPESFYYRFYAIRMEEMLRSDQWARLNTGVKLCGGLRRFDKIPLLVSLFETGNGFMRRNILVALANMRLWDPAIADLVVRALQDGYYEVRVAALALASSCVDHTSANPVIVDRMRRLMRRRFERFEVRYWCIRTLPLFVPLDEYFRMTARYRFARNVRLREAILEGFQGALKMERIRADQIEDVRYFLNDFLITTSGFDPKFSIRHNYVELHNRLKSP